MLCAPSIVAPIPNFVGQGESNLAGQDGTSMQAQLVLLPYGSQYRQTNLALGGRRISSIDADYQTDCSKFAVNITRSPYVSIVTGGGNDIASGATSVQVIDNLQSVFGKVIAAGGSLFACTIPPVAGFPAPLTAIVDAVNVWIRGHPELYTFLIDLHAMFPDNSDPLYYVTPPSSHFTALAQTIWAQAVNADLALL